MAVDEFGREIPAPASAPVPRHGHGAGRYPPAPSSPSYSSSLQPQHPHHPRGSGGGGPPPNLSQALSAPRHSDRERDRERDGDRDRDSYRPRDHHHRANKGPRDRRPSPPPKASHPSKAYQEEPLLCEYLWKQQQQQQLQQEQQPSSAEGETSVEDAAPEDPPPTTKPQPKQREYKDYRQAYCLRFIKSFFNAHLDHSWFRNLYSPSCQRKLIEQENARARQEAADVSRALQGDVDAFLRGAELVGTLEAKVTGDLPVPASHQLASLARALHVADIPPHVTDDQVVSSLLLLVKGDVPEGASGSNDGGSTYFQVLCTEPNRRDNRKFLYRDAVVLCQTPALRDRVVARLDERQPQAGGGATNAPPAGGGAIPRKEGESAAFPTSSSRSAPAGAQGRTDVSYELDVDCSDPYGRQEIDVDPHAGGGDAHIVDDHVLIPRVTATVHIKAPPQPLVHVLTAALSSPSRIPADKEAAVVAARALDAAKRVEHDKLDDILERYGANLTDAQVLDVTVAYLRRVHLFNFYTCSSAPNVGQFLTHPKHAMIHVRLQRSDANAAEGNTATDEAPMEDSVVDADDLLVKRRDEQIAAMLEACPTWISGDAAASADHDTASSSTSSTSVAVGVVTDAMQEQADAIEEAEKAAVETWLAEHSILDDDKRARCSFHFCHKLFKDSIFLRKHLMKKHGEFLRAEQAKCHDEFMMATWEASTTRPLCDILVDCGANFGLVPTRLLPQAVPDCVDPEPELWQRAEEKRKAAEEQRLRREEMRQQQQQQQQQSSSIPVSRNFVDVDDMKVEKVEISFDNVPDPTAIVTKKKKKRKLL